MRSQVEVLEKRMLLSGDGITDDMFGDDESTSSSSLIIVEPVDREGDFLGDGPEYGPPTDGYTGSVTPGELVPGTGGIVPEPEDVPDEPPSNGRKTGEVKKDVVLRVFKDAEHYDISVPAGTAIAFEQTDPSNPNSDWKVVRFYTQAGSSVTVTGPYM